MQKHRWRNRTYVAKHIVQNQADGIRNRKCDKHKELCQIVCLCAHSQGVARADALRCNLSKDDDPCRGAQHRPHTTGQRVHEDGEGAVHQHVAKEDGTEEEVATPPHGEDRLCILLLMWLARLCNNLKLLGVKRHEPKVEPREESREEEEDHN